MTDKLKVLTLIGTRPEIIKLSRIMAALDDLADHTIIHTGQNYDYELNKIFFDELKIRKPDYFLEAAAATPAQTVANVIAKTDELLATLPRPDALLVLGDTNSGMGAYAAKRRKIPVFHMEAGNRCFDERVPEEINRRIIDHISDINLVYSDHARNHLLREGLPPNRIIKTGSPMAEIFNYYKSYIDKSSALKNLKLKPHNYFLASLHREDNVDCPQRLQTLINALENLARTHGKAIIFALHPRTRSRLQDLNIDTESSATLDTPIRFIKPTGFFDYNALQKNAYCVISDSGTLTEEASLLGFPAVMLRQSHERPEGMDEAATIMADPHTLPRAIAIAIATAQGRAGNMPPLHPVADYTADNISTKILRIIASYTGYVERVVWHDYTGQNP